MVPCCANTWTVEQGAVVLSIEDRDEIAAELRMRGGRA